jgi:hypothetical protein
MFATMGLIINEIFELEQFDSEKLAKYLRCVFQVTLPLEDSMALQLLDQAIEVAREGAQVSVVLNILITNVHLQLLDKSESQLGTFPDR